MSRLAYVMITFPTLTETFILHEIEALQAAGVEVELFSLSRPSALNAKAEGQELAKRTFYSPSLVAWELWPANARVLKRWPGRYLRTLGAVLARTALNPVHCMKSLCLFPMAVVRRACASARDPRTDTGPYSTTAATWSRACSAFLQLHRPRLRRHADPRHDAGRSAGRRSC
jgi:hypothetical protein